MYAQEARRLCRAEKRSEWLKKNNQPLVISAKPESFNTLSLKKSYVDRVTKAVETVTESRLTLRLQNTILQKYQPDQYVCQMWRYMRLDSGQHGKVRCTLLND